MTTRLLGILLALALGWGVFAEIRVARADAARADAVATLERERAEAAESARAAEQKERAKEARIAREHLEAINAAHEKSLALARDRDRAAATARSLRDELVAIRAGVQTGPDPGTAEERAATRQAVAMLADLLGRCSDRRAELARYADEARIAGELCVGAYDSLNPPKAEK